MFSNITKKQKPEDMLIRVIRVAEILAKNVAESTPAFVNDEKSTDCCKDESIACIQKTQR